MHRIARTRCRVIILVPRPVPPPFHANGDIAARQRPRKCAGRAVAVTPILFFGLTAGALEASAGRRNCEIQLPATLRGICRGAPKHIAVHHAQPHALLHTLVVSAVRCIRDNRILVACELILAEKPGRTPAGTIRFHTRVHRDACCKIVHRTGVELRQIGMGVGAKSIVVLIMRADDSTTSCAMIESAE